MKKTAGNVSYGDYWSSGDVIGCLLDIDQARINFFKNGNDLGVAFNNVRSEDGFYPALSVYRGMRCVINFGRTFVHAQVGAYGLNPKLSKNEEDALNSLFQNYHDMGITLSQSGDTGDVIKGNGTMQLATDLGSTGAEDDPLLLILSWKMQADALWEFSRTEWLICWALNNCFNIEDMKTKVDLWRNNIRDNSGEFKSFYYFVFTYLKAEQATAIPTEEALLAWGMVGLPPRWTYWGLWTSYLEDNSIKSINKDTWNMVFRFIDVVKNDINNYDSLDCWPGVIDDFAEYIKSKK